MTMIPCIGAAEIERHLIKLIKLVQLKLQLTRKLPKAELKMAPASFPPTALVSMTADETGGGIHPTTCSLNN